MTDKKLNEDEGTISLWMPETDTLTIAVLGKMGEEASELSARCHRAIIQGVDAIDPANGHSNRYELQCEMADIAATLQWCHYALGISTISSRVNRKLAGFQKWQNLILEELKRQGKA
jgi:hypothetical protein